MFSSEATQPMMVGSPTSPTSPTSPLPQERSSFLPAYLMGDPAQSPAMVTIYYFILKISIEITSSDPG